MISDVLCEALWEIERYESDNTFRDSYSQPAMQAKLLLVKGVMRELLRELDEPPPAPAVVAEVSKAREALYAQLGQTAPKP